MRSGHPIAAILEARGMLHNRFAAQMGMTPYEFSHALNGRRRPEWFEARAAQLLGIPAEMLRVIPQADQPAAPAAARAA